MHERYGDQGVVVLSISYEPIGTMKAFLDKSAYTMPAGSDPNRIVINAYGVRSYPSSALIGRDGKLLWKGSPYGSEHAIAKALKLPLDIGGMLSAYLDAPDTAARRFALERLIRVAPARFDLKAWAGKAELSALPEGKTPTKLATAKALEKLEKGDSLAGHSLRAHGDEAFDLAAWARKRLVKLFPLKSREMKALLEAGHYRTALDALLTRKASGSVFKAAAKDDRFAQYCRNGFEAEAGLAKKAIMGHGWVFANRIPSNNQAFWSELSVSGVAQSEDRKHVVGLLIGGAMVRNDQADSFIDRALMKHFIMRGIAEGGKTSTKKAAKAAKKERARILSSLKSKYGWTDPVNPR